MTPDSDNQRKQKTAEQTAQRILALIAVVGKIHAPEWCFDWLKKHDVRRFLSSEEKTFVDDHSPSEQSRVSFSWRAEAMVALLWALNAISEMPPFNEQVQIFDVEMVRMALEDPVAFVINARFRDAHEINEMESNLYHQHWRVRDAELVGIGKYLEPRPDDPPIEDLNPGIVYERRYGLSWVVGWGDDWDNVPTDT